MNNKTINSVNNEQQNDQQRNNEQQNDQQRNNEQQNDQQRNNEQQTITDDRKQQQACIYLYGTKLYIHRVGLHSKDNK